MTFIVESKILQDMMAYFFIKSNQKKKIKISENETEEYTKKILVNKGKNLNDQNPKNKNIINKSKIEQILLQKKIVKFKSN